MADTCNKCKYFKTRQGPGRRGECRRYPPENFTRDGSGFPDRPIFPMVISSTWCGEFARDGLVKGQQPNAAGSGACPGCGSSAFEAHFSNCNRVTQ